MVDEPGGATPSTGHRRRRVPVPLLVTAVLVVALVGTGAGAAAAAGVAEGVRAVANTLTSGRGGPGTHHGTVTESMRLRINAAFGPRYTNPNLTVYAGETVILRITSYDDGAAPLMGSQMMFDKVAGTVGGTETVDGKTVRSVPNIDVAHTFTVPGLGLNLPIPAWTTGGSVTVVARFVAHRPGSFVWQCYAPCGSGVNGMGGPMSAMGWMEGRVTVVA